MVKKLIRHEFVYYLRTFSIFLPIMLAVGIMTKILILLNDGSIAGKILVGSSVFMFYMAAMALLMMSFIISVIRFFKNMYSAEGYLTFTLPISNAQHIFVKLLVAIIVRTICFAVIVLSLFIVLVGEPILNEFFSELALLFREAFEVITPLHLIAYLIEIIILLAVGSVLPQILIYACITIGQLAKRNRVLLAIGVYFGIYSASQTFATIALVLLSVLIPLGAFDSIVAFIAMYPLASIHIIIWVTIIFTAAFSALFWFITQRIMNRKLNLE